jgi:hypothetical protein
LDEERGEQVAKLLFLDIPEVKIKVRHQCLSIISQVHDILYDRGTKLTTSVSHGRKASVKGEPNDTFPGTRYRNRK